MTWIFDPTPRELNLIQLWNLDVILEYQPEFGRIVIKKPSGQVFVTIDPRDIRS